MSSASPYESDTPPRHRVGTMLVRRHCLSAARFVGFWTAVLLPFVLLVLLATGIVAEQPLVAAGLLAANLVSLVVGQDYHR
jgi:hypothetical protein